MCAPRIRAGGFLHGLEGEGIRSKLFACATKQRLRDYLTRDEVASLLRAAKKSPRHGARNHAMILIENARHGRRS